jgi:hypothetical protein
MKLRKIVALPWRALVFILNLLRWRIRGRLFWFVDWEWTLLSVGWWGSIWVLCDRWFDNLDTTVFAFFFLLFGVMRTRREREIRHGQTLTLDPLALEVRRRIRQRADDIRKLKEHFKGNPERDEL